MLKINKRNQMAPALTMLKLAPMQPTDLDDVMGIETSVYSHPWSKGNFVDSLAHAHDAWVVRSIDGTLSGYFVQMPVVDEMQLLTIAVERTRQGQGIGQYLLRQVIERAKFLQMDSVSLEVRASNLRALAVYRAFGFSLAGHRKNYYETSLNQREDALIWRYQISP